MAADLDDLAVDGDNPAGQADLRGRECGQFAPPQPGVGGEIDHQLVQGMQRASSVAEPGDVFAGRYVTRVYE